MNVQGRLTDGSGTPVPAGVKVFTFKIFDQPVGGTEIWPAGPGETQAIATNADGLWTAAVGDNIPLTESVFQDTARWLEITVDNGVDPPEALDRIKLNTNPYTYRSASSQTSDKIENKTLSDLDADYVNVPGDVMTGTLEAPEFKAGNFGLDGEVNVWANGPTSPVVSLSSNADGGTLHAYDESANITTGVEPDGNGDGGFLYVPGTAPIDAARAFIVDGNFNGTGNPKVTISGTGTYASFSTIAPGPGSVQLPDNAVEAEEMWDEPGLASSPFGSTTLGFNTTDTLIATITAQFPREGFALIIGEASIAAISSNTWITGTMYRNGSSFASWYWDPGDVDGFFDQRQTIVLTDSIPSGGFYTYDLRVRQSSGSASLTDQKLTVLFIPTAYGSVATPVAATDATELSGMELTKQNVSEGEPIDREASIQASIAANQARMDRELAQMKADMEALKAELRNSKQAMSSDGSER